MAMELIETVTVGAGGATSISFSNIPQDGIDLVMLASLRSDNNTQWVEIGINGSIRSFTSIDLFGLGNGRSANNRTDSIVQTVTNLTSWTSNTFSNNQLVFSDYAQNTVKSISHDGVLENNATTAYMAMKALRWVVTFAPITSLSINAQSGANFVQHSSISLYKIS